MIILICILFIELVAYFIYRGKSFTKVRKALGRKTSKDTETFTLRYAEHPFLSYSLNPNFVTSLGEKIHNKYGFRDGSFDNLDETNNIYCMGGSSTYCHYIEDTKSTWTYLLQQKLSDYRVINGGVGGWTSYQSLIRLCAWIDVIKPKLIIVYHGKNDFAPFLSGHMKEREIYPDYGNVMKSVRLDAFSKRPPLTYTGKLVYAYHISHKYMNILWHVYGGRGNRNGLLRVGTNDLNNIVSRYRSIISLGKERGIPVLIVTQKVISDTYKGYIRRLNAMIKRLQGCYIYDFANVDVPPNTLYDQVHFTPEGCELFSEKIKGYLGTL